MDFIHESAPCDSQGQQVSKEQHSSLSTLRGPLQMTLIKAIQVEGHLRNYVLLKKGHKFGIGLIRLSQTHTSVEF